MTTVPPGWVRITSSDPPLRVRARLSDERPTVTSGYGGWNAVQRPRRSPLTTWLAAPPLRMTLPILLDGFLTGTSVEAQIRRVEKMARATGADGTPPRLRVSTTGAAIPHQERSWVVEDLQWGDALMSPAGNRQRQQVTLSLLEYVADDRLVEVSAANQQRQRQRAAQTRAGASSKRVTAGHSAPPILPAPTGNGIGTLMVVETTSTSNSTGFGTGEDLLRIAARELGDANRWTEIADLNGIRDPRSISPGQVIRLP